MPLKRSGLHPRQAIVPPAVDAGALALGVEVAFEAVEDVVDLGVAGLLQGFACGDGAAGAAAQQQDWAGFVRDFLGHVFQEGGQVGLELGVLVPGDVDRAGGCADVEEFDFHADVDEPGLGSRLEQGPGVTGGDVMHGRVGSRWGR
jgi:hypothetical protein